MTWKTIDSAPKDGRPVRLKGGADSRTTEYNEVPVAPEVVAFFDRQDTVDDETQPDGWRERDLWAYAYWDGGWRSYYVGATHWAEIG